MIVSNDGQARGATIKVGSSRSVLRGPVQRLYPLEVSSGAETSMQEPKQPMLLKNNPPPPMASMNHPRRTLVIRAQEGIKKCLLKEESVIHE